MQHIPIFDNILLAPYLLILANICIIFVKINIRHNLINSQDLAPKNIR